MILLSYELGEGVAPMVHDVIQKRVTQHAVALGCK